MKVNQPRENEPRTADCAQNVLFVTLKSDNLAFVANELLD